MVFKLDSLWGHSNLVISWQNCICMILSDNHWYSSFCWCTYPVTWKLWYHLLLLGKPSISWYHFIGTYFLTNILSIKLRVGYPSYQIHMLYQCYFAFELLTRFQKHFGYRLRLEKKSQPFWNSMGMCCRIFVGLLLQRDVELLSNVRLLSTV